MATADIGTPEWQISGTPQWQAQTDLVHVSGKLQVAPYGNVNRRITKMDKNIFPIVSCHPDILFFSVTSTREIFETIWHFM